MSRAARPLFAAPRLEFVLPGLALLVAATFFMEFLDATILNPALPLMATSMGVQPIDLSVGVSIYALTLAVFILPGGWLAERFGARPVFTGAILLFTASSAACAASNSVFAFDVARAFQGLGGAMMVPVGRVVVLRTTEKSNLMRAVAILTWPGLTAPLLGPPLGGFLAETYSWRAIFLINLPLGLIAALLAYAMTPKMQASEPSPFDGPGFLLAGGALAAALLALDQISGAGRTPVILALAALATICAFGFVRHVRRARFPIISLRPFAIPTFRSSMASGTLARTTVSAVPFVLPLMFQLGMGYDSMRAGLTLTPLFVGNIGIKPLTTPILRFGGFRNVLVANALLQAATLIGCACLGPATPAYLVAVLLCVSGASRSLHFTALSTLPFADVAKEDMHSANMIFSVSFQASFAFGIGVGAAAIKLGDWIAPEPALAPFRIAFVALAALMIVAALGHARLAANAGTAVTRAARSGDA